MKKLLLLAGAVAMISFTGCHVGNNEKNNSGFDTLFTQAQADSLVLGLGQLQGWQNNTKFDRALEQDSTLSKDKFIKGIRYIINADTTTSFAYGMYTAFNVISQFNQWESMGLKVDRAGFYNQFRNAFMADSVNEQEAAIQQEVIQQLFAQLRDAQQKFEKAKLQASPEAIANVERGRQFVDSLLNNDAEVKATASGVAVKVTQAGEGENLKNNDRITMRFTGKTLDGRIFDKSNDENLRPVLVSTRVPGLQEGLTKLNKGSKATIYVPGTEAYGVEQNRRYNLGLNEMVIYEVEIVDIVE